MIVFFVATVVGALIGLAVGGGFGSIYLAILAGLLASIATVIVRNAVLARGVGVGPDNSRTPVLVVYAAVASLAGSLAAKEVTDIAEITAPVGIGAWAGLFAAFLLSMLMITYHTHPGNPPKLYKRA